MKKIRYYYTSMSKQVFLILLFLLILVRFLIFQLVVKHDLLGKAHLYNVPATIALNLVLLLLCALFLLGFKFFYTEFDDDQIIYHNRLLNKKIQLDFNQVEKAILSKRGIRLYTKATETPAMFIPFFRMGLISPPGVDTFYRLLKSKNISIEKQFITLPGHGKSKKIIPLIYSVLALITLASLTQAIALLNAIIKQH